MTQQNTHTELGPDMDGDDSVEDQALMWLMRVTSGTLGPEVLEEFERWRRADHRHEAALIDARHLWLQIGRPLEVRYDPVMTIRSRPSPAGTGGQGSRPRWQPALAAAAVLTFAIGLGQQWWSRWQFDQATTTGEQRALALADGSTMWLNTDSAVDISVTEQHRHVRLVRGEAFFDVKHDSKRPFTIDAGTGRVKVLGTAFGVYQDGDDMVVTVQRGRVEVSGGATPPVVITPDQRVRVHAGDAIKRVELVSADDNLSWRSGQLVFVDRPLSEILSELKRYDSRLLLVRYPDANRLRINVVIDLARLDEWYDGLEQSLPIDVTRLGPVVWLRSRDTDRAISDAKI